MGRDSAIEWTNHSFNPWVGCEPVSPACANCYAKEQVERFGGDFLVPRRTSNDNWRQPVRWNRVAAKAPIRPLVFCASLADVFDKRVPQEWRDDLFALIRATPHLEWILVTKRIGNAARMLPSDWGEGLANVTVLITVSCQEEADRDAGKLLALPAARRGFSVEPMLGPLDISQWASKLDVVIMGGESGHHARLARLDHMRALVAQCRAAGVHPFVKQLGARPIGFDGKPYPITDRKGAVMDDWPEDLRIREMPMLFNKSPAADPARAKRG